MNDIAQRIKIYRKSLGLTQDEFGRRLGVNGNAVSTWERGANYPSVKTLERMGLFEYSNPFEPITTYHDVYEMYCKLSNFDKGALYALICLEREESCI